MHFPAAFFQDLNLKFEFECARKMYRNVDGAANIWLSADTLHSLFTIYKVKILNYFSLLSFFCQKLMITDVAYV